MLMRSYILEIKYHLEETDALRIDNGDLEHICTQLRVFSDILGIY